MSNFKTTVAISLGGRHSFAIQEDQDALSEVTPRLAIVNDETNEAWPLGLATKQRIEKLQRCLESLKIHTDWVD